MQIPVFLKAYDGANAIRGRAADIAVLGLAGVVVAAGFIYLPRLAPPVAVDAPKAAFVQGSIPRETGESTEAFLERVASAHVASLSAPSALTNDATASLNADLTPAASRPATLLRHGARAAKPAVVASAPPAPQGDAPAGTVQTAAASAPFKIDWLAPVHYGVQLASDTGKFVAASNARVFGAIASAGDTLTSFVRKPKDRITQ